MDYKEKYEKAVQAAILAKQNTESAVTIGILEEIFPELRESESEDEKIRRNIIAALKGEGYYDCDLTNECIAWLEKQGGTKDKLNTMLNDSLSRETKETWNKFLDEQKPDWSEDDDIFFKAIVRDIENIKYISENAKSDRINWLKSLKDKVRPQPKQEWCEEDERRINHIIAFMSDKERIKDTETMFPIEEDIRWLKSLKPQINITDEELIKARNEAYNDALDKLEYHSDTPTFNDGWGAAIWYLKNRNAQFKNTCKPSDEQMELLKEAGDKRWEPDGLDPLYTLYQDLLKLIGE